jgi:hypothetical protein
MTDVEPQQVVTKAEFEALEDRLTRLLFVNVELMLLLNVFVR